MARVLLVDDEPHLVHALTTALQREGYEVLTATDGRAAVEVAATARPDLMILDLALPQLPGLEVIARVRPWFDSPILVLSGAEEQRLRAEALDLGADDYLAKPFGLDELLARLRALQRRQRGAGADGPAVQDFGALVIDLAAATVTAEGKEVHLTPTEWRLLRELLAAPERLLTHRHLLDVVWDSRHGEETRDTLRAHVRGLRAKIGDDARSPRYIRTESGAGYRWIAGSTAVTTPDPAPHDESAARPAGPSPAHTLANAVTALRMAVQLLADSPEAQDAAVAGPLARIDELSRRVSGLVAQLAAGDEEAGPS